MALSRCRTSEVRSQRRLKAERMFSRPLRSTNTDGKDRLEERRSIFCRGGLPRSKGVHAWRRKIILAAGHDNLFSGQRRPEKITRLSLSSVWVCG